MYILDRLGKVTFYTKRGWLVSGADPGIRVYGLNGNTGELHLGK
jgi:hypothetical protein